MGGGIAEYHQDLFGTISPANRIGWGGDPVVGVELALVVIPAAVSIPAFDGGLDSGSIRGDTLVIIETIGIKSWGEILEIPSSELQVGTGVGAADPIDDGCSTSLDGRIGPAMLLVVSARM